jgi:prepilin-type N-terminal cleavage/methylation domain-containing protein
MMNKNKQKGFTLVEVVVSVAVFALLAIISLQVYLLIINEIRAYRDKVIVASLANQYIENIRNLPYADIGTLGNQAICGKETGICTLPDLANPAVVSYGGVVFNVYYSISYVDDPTDGTGVLGTDADFNDYKQVKLYVKNTTTDTVKDFSTIVAPKGLESLGNRGGLPIEVVDYVGQPIQGATIHIVNNNLDPAVDITSTSGSDGTWFEILNPSVNGYQITVTKEGYSVDKTYPNSDENPNPTKPDVTIISGEVSPKLSFAIDRLSSLTFYTLNQTCQAMSGVNLEVRGSKLIGISPNIYKFDEIYSSDSSGKIYPASDECYNSKCLEWDNYTPALISSNYMVYGSSPIQRTNILPDTSQQFTLLLGPKTSNSMLVTVKDSSSSNPIEGAEVVLSGPTGGDLYTGGSVWSQNEWSDSVDSSSISTSEIPYALRLAKFGEEYLSSGWLESSIFDTGTDETRYTTLTWNPMSQFSGTDIRFQIATSDTNDEDTVWNFIGPDGTSGTYYESSGNTISSLNNNKRYLRYKVFLSTTDPTATPLLSNISLNYVSGCYTPGQAMFTGLEVSESGYQVTVNKDGYESQTIDNLSSEGYGLLEVSLNAQ